MKIFLAPTTRFSRAHETLRWLGGVLMMFGLFLFCGSATAHDLTGGDANFVGNNSGAAIAPFIYLGAKHMITGYDHILYLAGVIFFLRHLKHVVQFVTLFAVGHSLTLILAVAANWHVSEVLIDGIIALSVVYKALENMGGLDGLGRWKPDSRVAVFVFGLFHGLGLATSLQAMAPAEDGLLINLLSFNIGVEIGQLLALSLLFLLFTLLRRQSTFERYAFASNTVIMCAGFIFLLIQIGNGLIAV
ncbi:HupE/UreJ family protein [Pseudohongiella nitratireducens]|nr:HupE/UreJ family protein [Pseudohongiella nitratireducens]MDF1623574.1 HupE/UreJ family protein [Pseudohongiella nitratireducens]